MLETLRRLSLGITLILIAAATLLLNDLGSRKQKNIQPGMANTEALRIALVQHSSMLAHEDGAAGVIEALAGRGYKDGTQVRIKRFNAEADPGTASAIAKQVTAGDYDLIITIGTPSLQYVARANETGNRTKHVFGLVTDPYSSGTGIDPKDHSKHPPYLTGSGCMQPVAEAFQTAKKMLPTLHSVGLIWNPSESNSQAQTIVARKICSDLGIDLVESTVDNSTSALEAASALTSRGVQAIWISGDITVALAADAIITIARRAGIPVFTSFPPLVKSGSLFDLGANYFEIGKITGGIAADVLDGKNPADIPVENIAPNFFLFNETALHGLNDPWQIPPAIRAEATGWITATETKIPEGHSPLPAPDKIYKIGLAYFAPEQDGDLCIQGVIDGLKAQGLVEGKNLQIRHIHAQGEISNIPATLQTLSSTDVDLILPMSTPVIAAACNVVKNKPVVFTYCSDPLAAGAGKSFTDHLPNVTGIGSFPPVSDMVDFLRATMPEAKNVGTIYNPAEANSVKVVGVARELFSEAGIKLQEITVASSAEVLEAAQALASQGVDAFYIQSDNTVTQGFTSVVKAARDARIPLFCDDRITAKGGAVACVGVGFYKPGFAVAEMVSRVLHGADPASIPITNLTEKVVWIDRNLASQFGLIIPPGTPDAPAP